MKVPFSWLQDFFESPLSAADVSETLTLSGIEVDKFQNVGVFDPLVVAAEITELSPVPKANGVYKLSVGADRRRSVISNARGLAVGKKVALALPGATLFGGPELSLVEVDAGEAYGQPSEGMLAHAYGLGIGRDSETALEVDAPPGTPVAAALGAPEGGDRVLWLSILPNIARCQSMLGVAREVAALLNVPLRPRKEPNPLPESEPLSPTISAADAASVLTVTLVENVRVGESPDWLKRRLVLAGMTPINNVVDASNYVMLDIGQPSHPYDADKLPDLALGVRRTRAGERLLTLQQLETDEPMQLPEGIPVIVSGDVPVSLAGVLGGRPTAIGASTRRVLLEAAAFDYVAIRKSQRLAKVYSEASARFSRGVNPELPAMAARRFVEVLRETSPELRIVAYGEKSTGVPPERHLVLTLAELEGSLGSSVTLDEAAECLRRVGLRVAPIANGAALDVTVGNARQDITLTCDLVEEVARIRGYENIPETLPTEPIPERLHEDNRPREALRDALVGAGLQEIISYSLNGPEIEGKLYSSHPGAVPVQAIPLVNPVSVERSVLRTSLLPALLQTASANLRHASVCRLFELGPVFLRGVEQEVPRELERIGIVLAGAVQRETLHEKSPRSVDFFDIKAVVGELLTRAGVQDTVELVPCDEPPYRPGAAARILLRGELIGSVGAVHPRVLAAFDFGQHDAVVADLMVLPLVAQGRQRRKFVDYDRLPSIELDIALVVERQVTAGSVRDTARSAAGPWLRSVEVFDQFFSDQFGEGKKALAIRLRLNAGERTLEMAEALEVRARVASALATSLAAQIRE